MLLPSLRNTHIFGAANGVCLSCSTWQNAIDVAYWEDNQLHSRERKRHSTQYLLSLFPIPYTWIKCLFRYKYSSFNLGFNMIYPTVCLEYVASQYFAVSISLTIKLVPISLSACADLMTEWYDWPSIIFYFYFNHLTFLLFFYFSTFIFY